MIRRGIFAVALVLFSSVSLAQVPEYNVIPDSVDRNFSAFNQHDAEFSFTNQDSTRKIYNVTLENTSYLSWDRNRFNLNASQTRTVNASLFFRNISTYSEVLESDYKYNGSDNDFSGPNITLDISTFYEDTSISLSTFRTDFELEFDEGGQSAFTVENTGNETAYNVSLAGDDVEFERQSSFDLPPGEDVLVQYNVSIPRPEENPTEATNQTYTREIEVSGSNFDTTTVGTSVSVPFQQFDTEEQEESLVDQVLENRETLIDFCNDPENQDSILCGNQIVEYRNNTEIRYRTPRANISLTDEEILALKQLANTTTKKYNDILNRVQLQQNTFRSQLDETRNNFSASVGQLENDTAENRERIEELRSLLEENNRQELQEARNRTFWMRLLFVLGVLYLIGKAGLWIYKNWEELTDDPRWT